MGLEPSGSVVRLRRVGPPLRQRAAVGEPGQPVGTRLPRQLLAVTRRAEGGQQMLEIERNQPKLLRVV